MNDDKLRQSQARAVQFKQWCDGPEGLYAVFAAVERNYLETLVTSEAGETGIREQVYARVNALRDIRRAMEAVIADGANSAAIITRLTKLSERQRKPKARA